MKGFTFTLLTASIVGGIINTIISKKSKLKKYVSFIVTLVCTLSLLQPISQIFDSVSELKNSVAGFFESNIISSNINSTNEAIINTSKEKIENGIKELVIQKYKFPENEVAVEIILDDSKIDAIKIEKIYVYISGKSSWSDADTIKNYLSSILSSDIYVKRR